MQPQHGGKLLSGRELGEHGNNRLSEGKLETGSWDPQMEAHLPGLQALVLGLVEV